MVDYITNLVTRGHLFHPKCGFLTQVQSADFLLVSECLWMLNLCNSWLFCSSHSLFCSLFISMFPLSVFLLTVFGLSLCFSCPRHRLEDPKPLAVPGIISSMFIGVEDSLGYWEIPEANCSTVVSQSAFIKWLLFTEHSGTSGEEVRA